jgi:hypothetical protein
MKLSLRKLEIGDLATLERLVVENIEAIEPGLQVVDSRLLLGHSTIDLVAQDAYSSLVLLALGSQADEAMLLRMVDAYSWCLEYADAVRRHFPALALSDDRPPRIVFVTERVPESFHRKMKQFNFPAIDLVEFRLLEVNGVPVPYVEAVARIRRDVSPVAGAVPYAPVEAARRNGHAGIAHRPDPVGVPPAPIAAMGPPAASAPVVTPAPPAPPAQPSVTLTRAPAVVSVPAPSVTAGTGDHSVKVEVAAARAAALTGLESAMPDRSDAAVLDDAPVDDTTAVEAVPEAALSAGTAESAVEPPATETAAQTAEQKYLFSEAARATQIARDFGIELPKDGMLTRQWVDFLNQLAAR